VRLILALIAVLVLAAAMAAAPALADNNFVYSGTLDGSTTSDGSGDTTSAHVSWSEIGSSPTANPSVVTWSLPTLSGNVTFSGDSATNAPSCSGTLSAAPNPNKVYAPGMAAVAGGYEVVTYSPATAGSSGSPMDYQVQSTAPYGTTCGASYNLVAFIEGCARNNVGSSLDAALRPDAVFPGGSTVKRFDVPALGGHANCSSQYSFSLSSSIQFTGDPVSGNPTPTPSPTPPPATPTPLPPSPTKAQQKLIAVDDIVKTLPRTGPECYDSAKASLAARFNGGVLTPEAAALLIPTADVLCSVDLRRLLHDWIVTNDPPDANFGAVAVPAPATLRGVRLPACRGDRRSRRFCRVLRPKLLSLILAARTAESVSAAMETTVNRLSGAEAANNAAGVTRQEAAALDLRTRMSRAAAARDTLGTAVAKEIRGAGVRVTFTKSEDANGLRIALKRLAKDGVTISAFIARAGAAASPKATDLLALL
jgi:hypothetical protein